MAKSNDPLMESLMQMAVAAAPLIRKVRESGLFRDRDTVVEAEVVTPETAAAPAPPEPPMPPPAAAPPPVNPDTGALQDIVVRQALRINELESEVAAMKAAAAHKATKTKPKPKVKTRAKAAPAN